MIETTFKTAAWFFFLYAIGVVLDVYLFSKHENHLLASHISPVALYNYKLSHRLFDSSVDKCHTVQKLQGVAYFRSETS